jgi:hypothetical protein
VAVFVFVAVAVDVCGIQTWISVPGDPFASVALGSIETAAPFADCVAGALWAASCAWPPAAAPVCTWLEPWVTTLPFAAVAVAAELFVCDTGASSPGLLFRTTTFLFVGAAWAAVAWAFDA